jgi:hypothetical protein
MHILFAPNCERDAVQYTKESADHMKPGEAQAHHIALTQKQRIRCDEA